MESPQRPPKDASEAPAPPRRQGPARQPAGGQLRESPAKAAKRRQRSARASPAAKAPRVSYPDGGSVPRQSGAAKRRQRSARASPAARPPASVIRRAVVWNPRIGRPKAPAKRPRLPRLKGPARQPAGGQLRGIPAKGAQKAPAKRPRLPRRQGPARQTAGGQLRGVPEKAAKRRQRSARASPAAKAPGVSYPDGGSVPRQNNSKFKSPLLPPPSFFCIFAQNCAGKTGMLSFLI